MEGLQPQLSAASDPLKKPSTPEFLLKLYKILQQEDRSIIEWESGHIHVKDPNRLARNILSKYFRHNKFSSFQRQLNYFGFHKTEGKGKHAPCVYTNDTLVGANLEELLVIKRKTSVSNKIGSPLFGGQIPPDSPSPVAFGRFSNAEIRSAQLEDVPLMPMEDFHHVLDSVLLGKRGRDLDENLTTVTSRPIESLPENLFRPDARPQFDPSIKRSKNEIVGVPRIKSESGPIPQSQNAQIPCFVPYSKAHSFSEPPFSNPAGQATMFNREMMPFQSISRGMIDFRPIQPPQPTPDLKPDEIFSASYLSRYPGQVNGWGMNACATEYELGDTGFPPLLEPFHHDFDLKQPNEEADWVWDVLNEALIDDPQLSLDDGLLF